MFQNELCAILKLYLLYIVDCQSTINQMTIINLLKNGSAIAFKNFLPLLGSLILYILTIWIPYINIGTTIAIWTLPAVMSRGETISPTQIFDSKYRKNMGNFFLLLGFMFSGFLAGFIYGIIPGIVLA